jgi:XRE family transcriptional regulator, regulator of sulfur utilization
MITPRDLKVAALAVIATFCTLALAGQTPVLHSTVFNWNSMVEKPTPQGSIRSVCRRPTATLDELEMHVTTLNPGQASHPPHKHPNEEVIIIREGAVETLSNGQWVKAGPGSIVFEASNELHATKNVGTTQSTYTVISFKTDKTPSGETSGE